jgi:hypothetical protein
MDIKGESITQPKSILTRWSYTQASVTKIHQPRIESTDNNSPCSHPNGPNPNEIVRHTYNLLPGRILTPVSTIYTDEMKTLSKRMAMRAESMSKSHS